MVSVEEAFKLVAANVNALPTETVPLGKAVGRTLAQEVTADRDSPPWRKSMMDGFAVRSEDINAGQKLFPVNETVTAGGSPTMAVESGTATRIMTGAPVPDDADAIVMIERCTFDESSAEVRIEIDSIASGKHLMERGVNFADGDPIFSAGRKIRDLDIGLMAEVGAAEVLVYRQPTAAVLPTGDELVDPSEMPTGPQIRNSNGPMLLSMLASQRIEASDLGIGRDNRDQLLEQMKQGLKQDVFLLSGGVSAGTLDLVPSILKELGVEEVFHKVTVKPGKPIFFGIHHREDGSRGYVFGLPGNPVSSLVGFRLFVSTAIRLMTGQNDAVETTPQLSELSRDHETRGDRPTFWPGRRISSPDSSLIVEPLNWNGSSDLVALGKAEGLIEFPAGTKVHESGAQFPFWQL